MAQVDRARARRGRGRAGRADGTARFARETEQQLLDRLIALAARVERSTAEHGYRFSATRAYADLVEQRIAELRGADHSRSSDPGRVHAAPGLSRRSRPWPSTRRRLAGGVRARRAPATCCARVNIVAEGPGTSSCSRSSRAARNCSSGCSQRSRARRSRQSPITWSACCCTAPRALKGLGVPLQPELTAGALVPVALGRLAHDAPHPREAARRPLRLAGPARGQGTLPVRCVKASPVLVSSAAPGRIPARWKVCRSSSFSPTPMK